eukprot:6472756-Amphidinium_carterae.2
MQFQTPTGSPATSASPGAGSLPLAALRCKALAEAQQATPLPTAPAGLAQPSPRLIAAVCAGPDEPRPQQGA